MKVNWKDYSEYDGESEALFDFNGFTAVGVTFKGKLLEPYTGKEFVDNVGKPMYPSQFLYIEELS